MDYSSPGSSVHGIFQARILEKVAISSSRGSPQPRDRTHASCVSCIDRQILYQLHHLRKWSITVSSFLEHRGRTSGLLRQKARSVHWVLTMPESQEIKQNIENKQPKGFCSLKKVPCSSAGPPSRSCWKCSVRLQLGPAVSHQSG